MNSKGDNLTKYLLTITLKGDRITTKGEYTTHEEELFMGIPLTVSDEKKVFDDNHRTFEEREKELKKQQEYEEKQHEREKQSPFTNWYQFNREHSKDMIWLANNYPKAQVILLFLLEHMDDYNAVMCSYRVFQDAFSISKNTVTRNLNVLKEKGFIVIMKSGSSNVYIVNKNLAWSSWGNNLKYCKFPANVILSAAENKEYADNMEKVKLKQIIINGDDKNGNTNDTTGAEN